jgi:hypothetical protein
MLTCASSSSTKCCSRTSRRESLLRGTRPRARTWRPASKCRSPSPVSQREKPLHVRVTTQTSRARTCTGTSGRAGHRRRCGSRHAHFEVEKVDVVRVARTKRNGVLRAQFDRDGPVGRVRCWTLAPSASKCAISSALFVLTVPRRDDERLTLVEHRHRCHEAHLGAAVGELHVDLERWRHEQRVGWQLVCRTRQT